MRRIRRLLLFFLAGLILVLSPAVDFHRAAFPAEVAPATTQVEGVELPDLGQITFSTLPAIAESGSFSAPPEVVEALGYDPSRSWSAGQTAEEYLKLGDFQESFQLQKYNLETLATMGGTSAETAKLSDFELMNRQTVGDLVTAIPELANRQIAEVPPIADLLSQSLGNAFDPTQTLGFVAQKTDFSQLSLGEIDLTIYDLNSIPGIKFAPLETFREWQNTLLKGIPGLKDIPWSQFLNPVTLSGGIGKVDVVLGSAEKNRAYTISGSYKEGFQVPCLQESCPHIEMAGLPLLKGRQWISGKAQKVKGGHGILGMVNGGKEPTGRHPFGNAFKVVLTAAKEAEAKAEFGLYFRFCAKTKFVDFGCTPYVIGPIPWIPAKEKDWIFLGFLEGIDKKAEAFKKPPAVGTPPINGNPFLPGEESVPTSLQPLNAEQFNFDPNGINFSDRTTVLQGSVVQGNQENIGFWGHVGGFFKGAWDGGVETVKGIGNMAKGAWNLTGGWIFNPEESKATVDAIKNTAQAVLENPLVLWDAVTEPITSRWNEGKYGEAIGVGAFEVLSIFVGTKGLDKIAKGSKLGKLGKIGNLADKIGDAGKITKRLSSLSVVPAFLGKILPKLVVSLKEPLKKLVTKGSPRVIGFWKKTWEGIKRQTKKMSGINRQLILDKKHVAKHLPDTPQMQRLLQKEGSAHVFNDEATMQRVAQSIMEKGEFTGSVRGHKRYGMYFSEPIGYRISKDGSKIPLYYGEIKVKGDMYHVIPRTNPSR